MLARKYSPGQVWRAGWDRPSGPREGPACGAKCPHERRSAARGRDLWSGGTIGERGSGIFLFAGAPAQTVALEFDTMSVVNDAVQDGVAQGWVTEQDIIQVLVRDDSWGFPSPDVFDSMI